VILKLYYLMHVL